MKNKIVSDGLQRFLRERKTSAAAVEKEYAIKIAKAKPDEKRKLQEQMAKEYRKVWMRQNHVPSAGTLW
jgi:hypothetical protein